MSANSPRENGTQVIGGYGTSEALLRLGQSKAAACSMEGGPPVQAQPASDDHRACT